MSSVTNFEDFKTPNLKNYISQSFVLPHLIHPSVLNLSMMDGWLHWNWLYWIMNISVPVLEANDRCLILFIVTRAAQIRTRITSALSNEHLLVRKRLQSSSCFNWFLKLKRNWVLRQNTGNHFESLCLPEYFSLIPVSAIICEFISEPVPALILLSQYIIFTLCSTMLPKAVNVEQLSYILCRHIYKVKMVNLNHYHCLSISIFSLSAWI